MPTSRTAPAFPVHAGVGRGLTKFEWLAGQALAGLLAGGRHCADRTNLAHDACALAAAVMETVDRWTEVSR